jgi:hypothetical protein
LSFSTEAEESTTTASELGGKPERMRNAGSLDILVPHHSISVEMAPQREVLIHEEGKGSFIPRQQAISRLVSQISNRDHSCSTI